MKASAILLLVAVFSAIIPASAFPEHSPEIPDPSSPVTIRLDAAGATFPYPLIDLWRVEYKKEHPSVSLNYQSVGSGSGVRLHTEKTVDFAASDAPLSASETANAPLTLHIPETIGGVVIAYNIPELPESGLKLTGSIISKIFLGQITQWNDPQIAEINPDMALPDEEIVVISRADGSGTTYVFTDYLSTIDPEFERQVGQGKNVPWPVALKAAGNEGVALSVQTTDYSIGYVELAYAFRTGMSYAAVQNGDGSAFVEPSLESISAASQGAAAVLPSPDGDWSSVTLVNAPGPDSYPITSFTYLLVHQELNDVVDSIDKAKALVHLIYWMITDGQEHSASLLYVPLADSVVDLDKEALSMITFDGQPVWSPVKPQMVEAMPPTEEGTGEEGGCLIATAAYGTELAPQVQRLREARDMVVQTESGAAFMSGFSSIYYAFSPAVADLERQSPELRAAVGLAIYPMIASLGIMEGADTEAEVLGYGIAAILANMAMYIGAPIGAIMLVRKAQSRAGSN